MEELVLNEIIEGILIWKKTRDVLKQNGKTEVFKTKS